MATKTRTRSLRAPRLSPAERQAMDRIYGRLEPVTYVVIAGPAGSPTTVTMWEDPERLEKGRRR